jgi:hypothetical protein
MKHVAREIFLCAPLLAGCATPERAPSITVDRSLVRADLDRDGRPDLLVRLAEESRAVNVTWNRDADGGWRLYWFDSRPSRDEGAGLEVVRGEDGETFRLETVGLARPATYEVVGSWTKDEGRALLIDVSRQGDEHVLAASSCNWRDLEAAEDASARAGK